GGVPGGRRAPGLQSAATAYRRHDWRRAVGIGLRLAGLRPLGRAPYLGSGWRCAPDDLAWTQGAGRPVPVPRCEHRGTIRAAGSIITVGARSAECDATPPSRGGPPCSILAYSGSLRLDVVGNICVGTTSSLDSRWPNMLDYSCYSPRP